MKIELSHLQLILIRHALGVYAGRKGFKKNPKLKNDMREIGLDICQKEFSSPCFNCHNINVRIGKVEVSA